MRNPPLQGYLATLRRTHPEWATTLAVRYTAPRVFLLDPGFAMRALTMTAVAALDKAAGGTGGWPARMAAGRDGISVRALSLFASDLGAWVAGLPDVAGEDAAAYRMEAVFVPDSDFYAGSEFGACRDVVHNAVVGCVRSLDDPAAVDALAEQCADCIAWVLAEAQRTQVQANTPTRRRSAGVETVPSPLL